VRWSRALPSITSRAASFAVYDPATCSTTTKFILKLGWLHARIQTWFPFHIQIALNGREWLSRSLQEEKIAYVQHANCFLWIEDFRRAQELMDEQLKTNWAELLQSFVKDLNPLHEEIFEKYPAEYWTCYQSEWATDIAFREAAFLKRMVRC